MLAIYSTFFLAFYEHIHLGQNQSLTCLLSSKPIIKTPFMFLFQMRKPNRRSVTRPIPEVKKYLISEKQLQMMGEEGGG